MSVAQFDILLAILEPHIKKKTTNFRELIDLNRDWHSFRLGISTVGMTVRKTCDQIWLQLKDTYMPTPTEDIWRYTARRLNEMWSFPNCIGTLDGNTFSIVLLALVDADYRFLAIDVGSYGGNSDGGIFANSALGRAQQRETLNVPPPLELPSAPELGKVNHIIIADKAFPMKPYIARRISKNAFGILTQRFKVYKRPMEVNPDLADSIVKATCILCNYLRHEVVGQADQGDSFDFDDGGNASLHEFQRPRGNRASEEALHIRDTFRKYFVSPAGEVPWQYDRLRILSKS
uniref:DDE Tnp4 domain-containing protein n=1 Tax=Cyprinus carpio TaxID=7962 RepID=A0A8C1XYC4_CYPCA